MSNDPWPPRLFDLAYFPAMDDKLDDLADLAEPESWDYQHTPTEHHKPILYNYLQYTYKRLADEDKLAESDDGTSLAFNTGLVTPNQEPLFAFFSQNRNEGQQPWFFSGWKRKGERDMSRFSLLPEMAHYFDDSSLLVFDINKEFRPNIEHIIADHRERFPEPYRSMDDFALQTFVRGAIDNARERARRNYKTAIPQYYTGRGFAGRIQLLLPLCIGHPHRADLAMVVEDMGNFYRASTCLDLDTAYNNARQLARPDRDWLQP
jgi:hypothetical protein